MKYKRLYIQQEENGPLEPVDSLPAWLLLRTERYLQLQGRGLEHNQIVWLIENGGPLEN